MPLPRVAPFALAVLLAAPIALTLGQARLTIQDTAPAPGLFSGAANWLKENSRPRSLVFQTSWDTFSLLFFYNTQNVYTAGLDPTYSELYDPNLYAEWDRITRGNVRQPGRAIRADFNAEYVMTDLRHVGFIRQAGADSSMKEVYRDAQSIVYRIGS